MEQKVFADKSRMRDSGVELLKIIAVILIVISHVVLTLITENEFRIATTFWIVPMQRPA